MCSSSNAWSARSGVDPDGLSGQVWIYKGRRAEDELYRSMWERAMDEMLDRLVYKNEASGLTYVAEIRRCEASQLG